ncbi:MAG TPA: hypothetical protein VIH99_13140 [Bdellovibrionota bacterium]|jgi:hypothetical protein
MKRLGLALLLLAPSIGHAGYFLDTSMGVQSSLVLGIGNTLDEARLDAQSAVPPPAKHAHYKFDAQESEYQCLSGGEWTQEKECDGGEVQYVLPLTKSLQ